MNGIESATELPNSLCKFMGEIRGKMSEPVLHPLRDGVTTASHDDRTSGQSKHNSDQQETAFAKSQVIFRMWNGGQRTGKKDRQHHQQCERPNVKDAFYRQYRHLRREGKFCSPRNQIGTNEFSRPPQHSQAGKSDQGWWNEIDHFGLGPYGLQQNLPSHGTQDVAESERLAGQLGRAGLRAVVLNAKNDAQEAAIVAEAGAHGAITVSTQMAGRGTDIRLGGAGGDRDLVAELGGLYVIGTGRHASSRLDQQLRGRAGRQGDPGGSVFFASMEDELILQYAPGKPGDQDHAQRVAEGVNLEIHRNTWQYNKLVEDQRRIVLHHRERVLRTDDALSSLGRQCPDRLAELSPDIDSSVLADAARQIVLFHLDQAWAEHLAFLADLREGIHLRALARGTVPLNEFNKEAIRAFGPLLERAAARSAETFRAAAITSDGVDLEAIGLKRPTATWTYLVHEDPFGHDIDRAIGSLARRFRKPVD